MYVFDTNSISVLSNYYPDRFPRFWEDMKAVVEEGIVVSVREVRRELEVWFEDDHWLREWFGTHRNLFRTPTADETRFVAEILREPHFQQLISRKSVLKGTPVADPFVIAAAKYLDGTVVTEEKRRRNAARIPNVCDHFAIPVIPLAEFLRRMQWSYD